MVHKDLPAKTLEEIQLLSSEAREDQRGPPICTAYGFFLRAEKGQALEYWILGDETLMDGCRIKLSPPLSDYPRAKLGDVVRIHRLSIDRQFNVPYAIARNVVVWPSFRQTTIATTCAKKPTITPADEERRRKLEALFCSKVFPICDLRNHPYSFDLLTAGRIEKKTQDTYGHLLLTIHDGTASIIVRVFHQTPHDKAWPLSTNEHFDLATKQEVGQYIFIGGGKLDTKNNYINLSANANYGRCLREVEKTSVLGCRINHSVKDLIRNDTEEPQEEPRLRRSPRLTTGHQIRTDLESSHSSQTRSQEVQRELDTSSEPIPDYTKLIDIMTEQRVSKGFKFYDIAGQVRGKPNEARQFGNWVLQLYDGSKIDFESILIGEVNEPVQNCVVVLVYSKQKETDTDKHIEVVKKLKDGDLILIKNVKVSSRNNRMKFELNANLEHGKGINMIDKESPFGRRLLEVVTNPIVEELLDDQPDIDVEDIGEDAPALPDST